MKRIAIALALCLSIFAQAQDTITIEDTGGFISKLVYDWTSDGAGAATGRTTSVVPGILFGIATTPDTTNVPTDLYDVVVKQAFTNTSGGVTVLAADLTAGAVANRSSTVVQWTDFWPTSILTSGGFIQIEVTNAGGAKEGRIEFYVYRTLAIIPEGGNGLPFGGVTTQLLQNSANGAAKWITMSGDATIADGGNLQLVDPLLIEGLTMTGILIAGTAPTTLTNADGTLRIAALDGTGDLLGTSDEIIVSLGTDVLLGAGNATLALEDNITLGVTDTTLGRLGLSGSSASTSGGILDIFNAADDDTNVDFWRLTANTDFELNTAVGLNALRIDDATLDVNLGAQLTVGSPTATPDGTLHVFTASAGAVTASVSADNLVVEDSGPGGISILTPDANPSEFVMGSPSLAVGALLTWTHAGDEFRISSAKAGAVLNLHSGNDLLALRLDSSQDALFPNSVTVGSSTVAADGTLHVHTASAGSVTANGIADEIVAESSTANGGMSVLIPDASTGQYVIGSPSDTIGALWSWNHDADASNFGTNKTGASLILRADNNAAQLTLSGAAGSQLATFASRIVTPLSGTARAFFNLPHGAAPTSPVNGDMWTTTAGLFVRINGVTVGPLS